MAGESAIYKKFRAEQDAADAAYKKWEQEQWDKNGAEWTKQGYTRTADPNSAWGSTWKKNPVAGGELAPVVKPEEKVELKEDPTKAWYEHMKTLGYKEEALDDGTKRFTHNNNLYYSNGRAKVDGKMIDYDYKTLAKAETPKLNPKSFDLETFRKNEGITSSNYITHAGNQYLRYDPDGIGDFYVGTDGSIYQANWFGGGLGNKLDHTTVNRDLRGTYLSNYNNLYNLISNFNVPTNKQGGTMNKVKYFQQGGVADIKEQIRPIVKAAMSPDKNQAEQAFAQIQQLVLKNPNLKPVVEAVIKEEQAQAQATSAKWGSKLQYIKSLKFAKGGKTCPACMSDGGSAPEKLQNKKQKMHVNPSDTVHVKGQPKSLTNSDGSRVDKRFPAYTAKDYLNDKKTKDGQKRRMKADLVSSEKCGGTTPKAKKHYFGGWL